MAAMATISTLPSIKISKSGGPGSSPNTPRTIIIDAGSEGDRPTSSGHDGKGSEGWFGRLTLGR